MYNVVLNYPKNHNLANIFGRPAMSIHIALLPIIIIIRVFCPMADISLQTQEPRSQFCPKARLPLQTQ